jgi:hypothetical protein
MKTVSKLATNVIAAGLLAGASLSANAINVGGVVWDPNSLFDFTSNSQLIEDQLDLAAGQNQLKGFGIVTGINNTFEATFCPSGCELTYTFEGFTVAAAPLIVGGKTLLAFVGGVINFFVDSTTAYDGNSEATASDGTLWLSLAGHAVADPNFPGIFPTLVGELTSFGAGADSGSGDGLLDVTGGLAFSNFDTDTQTDGSDFVFSSSFQPIPGGAQGDGYELFGTADLRGTSVPVPGSIALLGLGLLGMGASLRRNKKA